MICSIKFNKSLTGQSIPASVPGKAPGREVKVEPVAWSPYTAGPYLVPVTRWVE